LKYVRNKGQRCGARGCKQPAVARGLCNKHYQWVRYRPEGQGAGLVARGRHRVKPRNCSVEGCGKREVARGLCANHYQQRRRARRRKKEGRSLNLRNQPWKKPGELSSGTNNRWLRRESLKKYIERFRRLGKESKLSQKNLSLRLGFSGSLVSYHLKGSVSIEFLVAIACFFNVSTDWLLGLVRDRKPLSAPAVRSMKRYKIGPFTRRFRRLYRELGLVQQEFSARAGIQQTVVSCLLQGRSPNPETLVKISRSCRLTTDWLLGLTDTPADRERLRRFVARRVETEAEKEARGRVFMPITSITIKLGRIHPPSRKVTSAKSA
jgi:transcriptional regulator with XRE-family HTH domain